jgi:hypothetical protein
MGIHNRLFVAGAGVASALLLAAGGAAAANASTTAAHGHAHKKSACTVWADTHTFLHVVKARHAANGAVTITAQRETVHCGGPDDWHFNDPAKAMTAFVRGGARVQILTDGNSGIGTRTIRASQLVSYLPHDQWGSNFQVSGSLKKITGLSEVFHP